MLLNKNHLKHFFLSKIWQPWRTELHAGDFNNSDIARRKSVTCVACKRIDVTFELKA